MKIHFAYVHSHLCLGNNWHILTKNENTSLLQQRTALSSSLSFAAAPISKRHARSQLKIKVC